jgi:hypothetical protein
MKPYEIEQAEIDLEDSTDKAHLVIIKHSEGQITLSFAFGVLYSGESEVNGVKIKLK